MGGTRGDKSRGTAEIHLIATLVPIADDIGDIEIGVNGEEHRDQSRNRETGQGR